MKFINIDVFTKAYIDAALWSSMDESTESGGYPMDKNYGMNDIDQETLEKMAQDCYDFQIENKDYIPFKREIDAGHNFWLTRNGHGANFNDGDWPERAAYRLSKSAESYGEFNLYVGDDGKIHGS